MGEAGRHPAPLQRCDTRLMREGGALSAVACTEPEESGAGPSDQGRRRAVFLHTAWRSGGTWLWSRCREQPHVQALYEPLHEQLGRLSSADIRRLRPGSWASNHSDTPPYFQEYEKMMLPGRRGVPGYRQRFAYERFFLDPDDEDPELEAYLRSLVGAAAPGQVCVLKFCRSLGRTAWLQRRFPGALHAVVIGDPVAQWASAQTLLAVQRNRYFATVPFLVLARNADHPLVRDAIAALDVRLPRLYSPDVAYGMEACWRHLRRTGAEEQYRGFLAFWTACGIQALCGGAPVLDARKAASDSVCRRDVETILSAALCQRIDLRSRSAAEIKRAPWLDAAHQAASQVIRARGDALMPERRDTLLGYLATDGPAPARPRAHRAAPPAAEPPRTKAQCMTTSAAVLIARALQPIRRLHGALTRPQRQIT